jgi:hypothetical protein
MEEKNLKKEKIEINIDTTDNVLDWLSKILSLLKEYGPWKIIGATCLIGIVSALIYFMLNFTKVFEIYDAWKERQHSDRMELRMQMMPKIQSLTDKMTYSVAATRTLVLELHNGNTGNGGLPFTKCSATYESMNIGRQPIANQYQDVNLSLMPFAHALIKQGYWCGNTEELQSIDRGLYYKMKSNGTEHFAACVVEGIENKAIAFVFVSFEIPKEELTTHDCENVRNHLRHIAMELAVILEVTRLIE